MDNHHTVAINPLYNQSAYVPFAPRFNPSVGQRIKSVEYYPNGTVKRVEYAA